jgi:outer membrane protein assembly factor BamE (lipoprotein component of BamABCDE complex)
MNPPEATMPKNIILATLCFFAFAGCVFFQKTVDTPVQLGMSRSDLRLHFGEPLRIERTAAGGEDWYYCFVSWRTHPAADAGTSDDFGEKSSYGSVGWQASRYSGEHPIHVSSEGCVVGPLPNGKVLKE